MSLPKKDRKVRSKTGKTFPDDNSRLPGTAGFALAIAAALQRQFGETNAAVKMLVALTGANQRAAKNWLSGKNGPSGPNLVDLMRHSEEVLETVLRLAGRVDLVKAKKLGDTRRTLQRMLTLIDEIEGG